MDVIHNLEEVRVARLDFLVGIRKWDTDPNYGTSGTRMLTGYLMKNYTIGNYV